MFPCARFDDLSLHSERSFALRGLQEEIVARSAEDVAPALERVRDLTERGLWAGGYVAYEATPGFDPGLDVRTRMLGDPFHQLPLVWFGLFKRREPVPPLEPRDVHPAPYHVSAWTPTTDQVAYEAAISRIREHIAGGDTYQVNHTFRLRAAFSGDPFELYRDLMLAQRGAYGACFDAGRYRIVSASPERFFRIGGDRIEVRPMKGTIRRGRWPDEDQRLGGELLKSEKDRAENLMIVDLLRNDLGRVAEFGSVSVDQLLELERYETVWQLTSQISAKLRAGVDIVDVFRALFPSGSVTGAPKSSTMSIIADLEHTPRGVYCGAVGFIAPPGAEGPAADFNVAIRTVVIDQEEGLAEYGVGGGITWDSVSTAEYEEARLKSALLVERRPVFDLIETLRWDEAHGFWWLDEHLERVRASADYFGFDLDLPHIRGGLDEAVAQLHGSHLVRLTVTRDGEVSVEIGEELPPMDDGAPIRLALDDVGVSPHNVFLFHKTTRRTVYSAAAERHPDADDVLLVNDRGELTETTTGNIVVRRNGEWLTPALDAGLLGGVYRGVLLDKGTIAEAKLTVDDVHVAEELGVINSVRGWRRATLAE